MPAVQAFRLTRLAAAAACGALSLVALRLATGPSSPPPERPPGCRILALPAGLAMTADPLDGWEALAPPRERPAPPPAAAVAEPSARRVPSCRFQFHGTAGEGPGRVYYFFDTEAGRWFSLMPGQADAQAGAALDAGAGGAAPRLSDLANGQQFLIRPGDIRLEPAD